MADHYERSTRNEDKPMKLYLISQRKNTGYDTYDSAVVAAQDEAAAKHINPHGDWADKHNSGWCTSPKHVTAVYIGEAAESVKIGVVCASFNAG